MNNSSLTSPSTYGRHETKRTRRHNNRKSSNAEVRNDIQQKRTFREGEVGRREGGSIIENNSASLILIIDGLIPMPADEKHTPRVMPIDLVKRALEYPVAPCVTAAIDRQAYLDDMKWWTAQPPAPLLPDTTGSVSYSLGDAVWGLILNMAL